MAAAGNGNSVAPVEFEQLEGGRYRVSGALGFSTVEQALRRSRELFNGAGHIVVDLSGVSQVDSAGLALVIEWRSWFNGGGLRLESVPEQLLSLARIRELEAVLGLDSAGRPAHPGD
jgi:phospholipid transport system transporter-binding protein